jgi:hypothetical protein
LASKPQDSLENFSCAFGGWDTLNALVGGSLVIHYPCTFFQIAVKIPGGFFKGDIKGKYFPLPMGG